MTSFTRGSPIYKQGDAAYTWFEIVHGAVRTSLCDQDGERRVTAFYYRGDIFGVGCDTYAENAEAVGDVVLRMHRKDPSADHVDLRGRPCDERSFLRRALEAEHRRVLVLGRKTALQRVAAFFLELPAIEGNPTTRFLPMTRADIADHIGLTLHTVSRMVSDLTRRGYLAMDGRQCVRILDPRNLHELVGDEVRSGREVPGMLAQPDEASAFDFA